MMMWTNKALACWAVLVTGILGTALAILIDWGATSGTPGLSISQAVVMFSGLFVASFATPYIMSRRTAGRTPIPNDATVCFDQLEAARSVLNQIEGNARNVNTASKARSSSLHALIETARDLQTALKGASADVEENNSRLKEACEGVRDMDASTQRVLQRLKDGQLSSSELTQAVENLVASARAFEAASVSVSEISRKTQLLAVNALIEASRAGPAGRGFGVVASQVGDLSSRTNQVVSEISEKMEKQRRGLDQAQATLNQMLDHLLQSKADSEGSIETALRVRSDVEGSASVAAAVARVMGGRRPRSIQLSSFWFRCSRIQTRPSKDQPRTSHLPRLRRLAFRWPWGSRPKKPPSQPRRCARHSRRWLMASGVTGRGL